MELDFNKMQEAADRHAAESEQAFKDGLRAMREKQEARDNEIARLMAKAGEQESERKRQEMERKIEEQTAAAAETIRAKYAKEAPAEWNENATDKALRQLAKSLKG